MEGDTRWLWVPHDELVYIPAKLLRTSGEHAVCRTQQGTETTVKRATCFELTDILEINSAPNDLVQLSDVHPASILHTLRLRFERDDIYTSLGPILVSVNPFKWLPQLYSDERMREYCALSTRGEAEWQGSGGGGDSSSDGESAAASSRSPHVFTIVNRAYVGVTHGQSQAVIISGESGAGKTEATKACLRYLAFLAGSGQSVETKVLQTSAVLEAFGNAKTLRNNNSSRFGKFIRIAFDQDCKILGCRNACYLLEKSRIVHQLSGERNYHIFYQLLKGATGDVRRRLGFAEPSAGGGPNVQDLHFEFLAGGAAVDIENVDDAAEFRSTVQGLTTLEFSPDEQIFIWELLAGIMHLGNTTIRADPADDSRSIVEPNRVLGLASSLLGLEKQALADILSTRIVQSGRRRSIMVVPLTVAEAVEMREAIAKDIYNRLFEWIVSRINFAMNSDDSSNDSRTPSDTELGVLDIFGFEVFQNNSFEQLCINFANERLHRVFNQHVFQTELDLYHQQQISIPDIAWKDNQDLIELLTQKPVGLFVLLDEEGRVPRGSWQGLLRKFTKANESSSRLQYRPGSDAFTIVHYAGPVTYDPSAMLIKNKDTVSDTALEALAVSVNAIIRNLFNATPPDETPSAMTEATGQPGRIGAASPRKGGAADTRKATVAAQFRSQLDDLVTVLDASHPHFIRCVKSNSLKRASYMESPLCFEQLNYSGIFEAVLISQQGYPFRVPHLEFRRRFHLLATHVRPNLAFQGSVADQCRWLVEQLGFVDTSLPAACQVGTSMVFFRVEQQRILEKARKEICAKAARTVARVLRGHTVRVKFGRIRRQIDDIYKLLTNQNTQELAARVPRVQAELDTVEKVYGACFSRIEADSAAVFVTTTEAIKKSEERLQRLLAAPPLEAITDLRAALTEAEQLTSTIAVRGFSLHLHATTTDAYSSAERLVCQATKMLTVNNLLANGLRTEDDQQLRQALAIIDEVNQLQHVNSTWYDARQAEEARRVLKAVDDEMQILLPALQRALAEGQITVADNGTDGVGITADPSPIDRCLAQYEQNTFQTKKLAQVMKAAVQLRNLRAACATQNVHAAISHVLSFRWCAPWAALLDSQSNETTANNESRGADSNIEWDAESKVDVMFGSELTKCGKWLLHKLFYDSTKQLLQEVTAVDPLLTEHQPSSFLHAEQTLQAMLSFKQHLPRALCDAAVTAQASITFRRSIIASDLQALIEALRETDSVNQSADLIRECEFAYAAKEFLCARTNLRDCLHRELERQLQHGCFFSDVMTGNMPELKAAVDAATKAPRVRDSGQMAQLLCIAQATYTALAALEHDKLEDAADALGALTIVDLPSPASAAVGATVSELNRLVEEFRRMLHLRRLKLWLVSAMTEGRIRGVVGTLDVSAISTTQLMQAIEQALQEPALSSDEHLRCAQLVLQCRNRVLHNDWQHVGQLFRAEQSFGWLECCKEELELVQQHFADRELRMQMIRALEFVPYLTPTGKLVVENLRLSQLESCLASMFVISTLSPKTQMVKQLLEAVSQLRSCVQHERWEATRPSPMSELIKDACMMGLHTLSHHLQLLGACAGSERYEIDPESLDRATVVGQLRLLRSLGSSRLCQEELAHLELWVQYRSCVLQVCLGLRTAAVRGSLQSLSFDHSAAGVLLAALYQSQILPSELLNEPALRELCEVAHVVQQMRSAVQCQEYGLIDCDVVKAHRTKFWGVLEVELGLVLELAEDVNLCERLVHAVRASHVEWRHNQRALAGDTDLLRETICTARAFYHGSSSQPSLQLASWLELCDGVLQYREWVTRTERETQIDEISNMIVRIDTLEVQMLNTPIHNHPLCFVLRKEMDALRCDMAERITSARLSSIAQDPLSSDRLHEHHDELLGIVQQLSEISGSFASQSHEQLLATARFLESTVRMLATMQTEINVLLIVHDNSDSHRGYREAAIMFSPTAFLTRHRQSTPEASAGREDARDAIARLLLHWQTLRQICLTADQSVLLPDSAALCHRLLRCSCEWQLVLQLANCLPDKLHFDNNKGSTMKDCSNRVLECSAAYEALHTGLKLEAGEREWVQSPTQKVYESGLRLACLLEAVGANRYDVPDREWKMTCNVLHIANAEHARHARSSLTVQQALSGTEILGRATTDTVAIDCALQPLFLDALRAVDDMVTEREIRDALRQEPFAGDGTVQCTYLEAALRRASLVGSTEACTIALVEDAKLVLQLKKLVAAEQYSDAVMLLAEVCDCEVTAASLPGAVEVAALTRSLDVRPELLRVAAYAIHKHWLMQCTEVAQAVYAPQVAIDEQHSRMIQRLQEVARHGHRLHVHLPESKPLLRHLGCWSLLRSLYSAHLQTSRGHFLQNVLLKQTSASLGSLREVGLPQHVDTLVEQFATGTRTQQLLRTVAQCAAQQLIWFGPNGLWLTKPAVQLLQQTLSDVDLDACPAVPTQAGPTSTVAETQLLHFYREYAAFLSQTLLPIWRERDYIQRIKAVHVERYTKTVEALQSAAQHHLILQGWAGLHGSLTAATEFAREAHQVQQLLQVLAVHQQGTHIQDELLSSGQQLARLHPKTLCAQKLADSCQQLWQALVAVREHRWKEVETLTFAWKWPAPLHAVSSILHASSVARMLQRQFEDWCCHLPAPLTLGWSLLTSPQLQIASLPTGLLGDLTTWCVAGVNDANPAVSEVCNVAHHWDELVNSFMAAMACANQQAENFVNTGAITTAVPNTQKVIATARSAIEQCCHLSKPATQALLLALESIERELQLHEALAGLPMQSRSSDYTLLAKLVTEAPSTAPQLTSLLQSVEAYLVGQGTLKIENCTCKPGVLKEEAVVRLTGHHSHRGSDGHAQLARQTKLQGLACKQLSMLQDNPYHSYLADTLAREKQRPWPTIQCSAQDVLLQYCPMLLSELAKLNATNLCTNVMDRLGDLQRQENGAPALRFAQELLRPLSEAHLAHTEEGKALLQILELYWQTNLALLQRPDNQTREVLATVQQMLVEYAADTSSSTNDHDDCCGDNWAISDDIQHLPAGEMQAKLLRHIASNFRGMAHALELRLQSQLLTEVLAVPMFVENPEQCNLAMSPEPLHVAPHDSTRFEGLARDAVRLHTTLQIVLMVRRLARNGEWLDMLNYLQSVETSAVVPDAMPELKYAERFALNMLCCDGLTEAMQSALATAKRTEQVRLLGDVLNKFELNFEYWASAQTVLLWQSAESIYLVLRAAWQSELAGGMDIAENILQQHSRGVMQLTKDAKDRLVSATMEMAIEHQLAVYNAAAATGRLDLKVLRSRTSTISYRPLQLVLGALQPSKSLENVAHALQAVVQLRRAALANSWYKSRDLMETHSLDNDTGFQAEHMSQLRAHKACPGDRNVLAEKEEWRLRLAEFEMIYSLHCPADVELQAAGEQPQTKLVDAVALYHSVEETARSIADEEIQAAVQALEAWHKVRNVGDDSYFDKNPDPRFVAGTAAAGSNTQGPGWCAWLFAWLARDCQVFLEAEDAARQRQWLRLQEVQVRVNKLQLSLLEPFDSAGVSTNVQDMPISARYLKKINDTMSQAQSLLLVRAVVNVLQTFSNGDLWTVLDRVGDILAADKPSMSAEQSEASKLAIRLRIVHEHNATLDKQRAVVDEVLQIDRSAATSTTARGYINLILRSAERELRLAEKVSCLAQIRARTNATFTELKDVELVDGLDALQALIANTTKYADLLTAEEMQFVTSVALLVELKQAVCNNDWQAVDAWHNLHHGTQLSPQLRSYLDQVQDEAANARAIDNLLTLLHTHRLRSLTAILKFADDPQSQLAYEVGLGGSNGGDGSGSSSSASANTHLSTPTRRQSLTVARFADSKHFSVDIADLAARIVSASSVSRPTHELQHLINSSQVALALRRAIQAADWPAVGQLVRESRVATLHPLVQSELELAELALEYRSAVQHVTDALRRGGPRNTFGVVDCSNIWTAELEEALELAQNLSIKEPILHRLCLIADLIVHLRKAIRGGRWLNASSKVMPLEVETTAESAGVAGPPSPLSASATCIALRTAIITGSSGKGEQLFADTIQKIDANAMPEFKARSLDATETAESTLARIKQLDGLAVRSSEVSASGLPSYPPIIQDELSVVEQELEGRYLKSILITPLQHFQQAQGPATAVGLSGIHDVNNEPVNPSSSPHLGQTARPNPSESLRASLELLHHYHPITADGARLLNTARLMLAVREALAVKDWQAFEMALSDISKAQDTRAFTPYICDKELNAYRSNTLRCALLEKELAAALAEQRVQGTYYDLKVPTTQTAVTQWLDSARQFPTTGSAFRNLELLMSEAQCVLDARFGLTKGNAPYELVEIAVKKYMALFTISDCRPSWAEMSLIKAFLDYNNLTANLTRSLRYNCLVQVAHRCTTHQVTSLELSTAAALDFISRQHGYRFNPWQQNLTALEGPYDLFKLIASSLTVQPIIQCLSVAQISDMAISDWNLSGHTRPPDVVLARLLGRMASSVARARLHGVHQQMMIGRFQLGTLGEQASRSSMARPTQARQPKARRSSTSEATRRRHSLITAPRSGSFSSAVGTYANGTHTAAPAHSSKSASRRSSLAAGQSLPQAKRDAQQLADLPIFLSRADDSMLVPEAATYIEHVKNEFVNHVLRLQLLDPLCELKGCALSDRVKREEAFAAAHQAVRNVNHVVQDAESAGKKFVFDPDVLQLNEIWACIHKLRDAAEHGRFNDLELWVTALSEHGALFDAQAQSHAPASEAAQLQRQRDVANGTIQLELSRYRHLKEEHGVVVQLMSIADAIHSSASTIVEARIHSVLHRVEHMATLHPRIQQLVVLCDGLLRLLHASSTADVPRSANLSNVLSSIPLDDVPTHSNRHIQAICEHAANRLTAWLWSFHSRWTSKLVGRRRSSVSAALVGMVDEPLQRATEPGSALRANAELLALQPADTVNPTNDFVAAIHALIASTTPLSSTLRAVPCVALAAFEAQLRCIEAHMTTTPISALLSLIGQLILVSVNSRQQTDPGADLKRYVPEAIAESVAKFVPAAITNKDVDSHEGSWLAMASTLLGIVATTVLAVPANFGTAMLGDGSNNATTDASQGETVRHEEPQLQKSALSTIVENARAYLRPKHWKQLEPLLPSHVFQQGVQDTDHVRMAILHRRKNFQVAQL